MRPTNKMTFNEMQRNRNGLRPPQRSVLIWHENNEHRELMHCFDCSFIYYVIIDINLPFVGNKLDVDVDEDVVRLG